MYYTGEEQRLERWKDNFKLNMMEKNELYIEQQQLTQWITGRNVV
jgi:hypothetical protein